MAGGQYEEGLETSISILKRRKLGFKSFNPER
jgi:hypothetical protein